MALKDWKKIEDDEIGFAFSNKKRQLEIDYNIKLKRLQIYKHYNQLSDVVISKKLSKSQALKFAKSYMRKH